MVEPENCGRACEEAASTGRLDFIKKVHFHMGCVPYDKHNPLEIAASEGHYDVVKYLVEHTIVPLGRAAQYAEISGYNHIAEYLEFMS